MALVLTSVRLAFIAFINLTLVIGCCAQSTFWWQRSSLEQAKQQLSQGLWRDAYQSLLSTANGYLNTAPYSVMNKTLDPPSHNKHDYTSIAIYEWPCNATPPGCKDYPGGHWKPCNNNTGMPWRACDGIEDVKAIEAGDANEAHSMQAGLQALSLAYFFSGNTTYADKACQLVDVWFLNADTYMTPKLEYGQSSPGVSNGSSSGFIEWTAFPAIIDATALLENANCFKDKASHVKTWWRDFYTFTLTSILAHYEDDMTNNHGVWYDSTSMSLALASGNLSGASQRAHSVASRRIDTQILPSGQMPKETSRTKGASYSMYNLQAFTHAAVLANNSGVDLWSYAGPKKQSIRQAVDFLLPYASGQKVWPYSQIVNVTWSALALPLRHLSIATLNQTYEALLCGFYNDYDEYLKQELNLIQPPRFNISREECGQHQPVSFFEHGWRPSSITKYFLLR